ncbi:putative coproporphyrinogen oxidase [Helianthus anomalus]
MLGLLCELAAGMRQRKSLPEFRKDMPSTDNHKAWQQLRRGRYVDFINSIWYTLLTYLLLLTYYY